jgi:hypothetical protein
MVYILQATDEDEWYSVALLATGISAEILGIGGLYPAEVPATRVSF